MNNIEKMRRNAIVVTSTLSSLAAFGLGFGIAVHKNISKFNNNLQENIVKEILVEKNSKKADQFTSSMSKNILGSNNTIDLEKLDIFLDLANDNKKIKEDPSILLQMGKVIDFSENGDTIILANFSKESVGLLIEIRQKNDPTLGL